MITQPSLISLSNLLCHLIWVEVEVIAYLLLIQLDKYLLLGANTKILDNKDNNFQTSIYWPIRHQFENENTSYAAVYGNWAQVYDGYSGQQVWVPFSGFAGAAMARTDAVDFPWYAPAGFSRGLVPFSNDIAVNPNQKQRDEVVQS